jgi:3-oxochol-4-en-24-oyl-CoA dehydrogenase
VPIAITEEQLALQASIREWAKRAAPLALVRRLEPGSSPAGTPGAASADECWSALADLGIFSIAQPREAGGADGTVADLAAALEQLTWALVPGPVTPTLLASLVLAGHPDVPAVKAMLPALTAGRRPVAVGLTAGPAACGRLPDGRLRVHGEIGPVLGASPAADLLLGAVTGDGEVWFLLTAGHPGVTVSARSPVDFSRPLAGIGLADVLIAPGQVLGGLRAARVRDLAATLYAAEAAAVAGCCCDIAARHARTRHQFGRPVGSFQAVKHLCAGMLCRAERAAALAWDAARAADEAPDEHPLAAAAAAALALDAAVDNAKDCIQVLGGIGFTWEHDAHLYLRRALALRQLLGGSAAWRARAADLTLAGGRRRLGVPAGTGPAAAAAGTGPAAAAAGTGPGPQAARPDLAVGNWAVPAIVSHGSQAQRDRFVGPTLRGEIIWCQLFSEPEAGSDLASLRTRAERAAGGWRLSGQKVWTSLAGEADWAICLARTDAAAPKHRGITYFLVDMHSAGIETRPLREITGRAVFNEVFLDEVFVPDDCVVGDCGDGWRIARSTLAAERVAMGRGSALGDAVEGLIAVVRERGLAGDPGLRDQVGMLAADGLAVSLMDLRSALARPRAPGAGPGPAAGAGPHPAVRKLLGVAHRQSVAEAALTFCGPDGAAADGAAAGRVHEFLLTRCLSIAGGTTQILLSVAAEQVLGLPREPAPRGEAR